MSTQAHETPETANRFSSIKPARLTQQEQETLIKLALSLMAQRHRRGRVLTSPDQTRDFLKLKLGDRRNEVFGTIYLDNRHRIVELVEHFQGTIDGAQVHARVVVQQALTCNAAAVILFHNHPSGVAEPSRADEAITRRLRDALSLVDVRILDHFVISADEVTSFSERGLI